MQKKILVIGAAHLDIVGNYQKNSDNEHVYKDGTFYVEVGGVAFNIASTLCHNDYPVHLFTVANSDSTSEGIIEKTLVSRGIEHTIQKVNAKSESGFVAQTFSTPDNTAHILETGITAPLIDNSTLDKDRLRQCIRRADLVAVDCNVKHQEIAKIHRMCQEYVKPLFICSVSESKVGRALNYPGLADYPYELFSVNASEVNRWAPAWELLTANDADGIKAICTRFSTRHLLITNGKNGYKVFSANGKIREFNGPSNTVVASEIGAGDALFAAILADYSDYGDLNWKRSVEQVHDFVREVLASDFATVKYRREIPHVNGTLNGNDGLRRERYIINPVKLQGFRKKEKVRIMNCQLDASEIEFDPYHMGKVDYTRHNMASGEQMELITNYVQDSYNHGRKVDLVVFPELTVSKEQLARLRDLSAETQSIIVAGSQYYDENGHILDADNYGDVPRDDEALKAYNTATVLVCGEAYPTQKIFPSPSEIVLGSRVSEGREILKFCDSPIGNFVVIICYDFAKFAENDILEKLKSEHRDLDFIVIIALQKVSKRYYIAPIGQLCAQLQDDNGAYLIYCNALIRGHSDGNSAFFAYIHDRHYNELKAGGYSDLDPITKVLEHRDERLFISFDVDTRTKKLAKLSSDHRPLEKFHITNYPGLEKTSLPGTKNTAPQPTVNHIGSATAHGDLMVTFNEFQKFYRTKQDSYIGYLQWYIERIWLWFEAYGPFRIALGLPQADGQFDIPIACGITPMRLSKIKHHSNWKHERSFFALGVCQSTQPEDCFWGDKRSRFYQANESDVEGFKPSETHLIIPIKRSAADSGNDQQTGSDKTCLGVITISTVQKELLKEEDRYRYYNQIFPLISGIDAILNQVN